MGLAEPSKRGPRSRPAASSTIPGSWVRARRAAAGLLIAAYLAATGWFLCLQVLGDTYWHPVNYFFTWDMFPGYGTVSARRYAVGETKSGRYLQLLPGPNERFRWGVAGDLPRFDIVPTVAQPPLSDRLLDAIDHALKRVREDHQDDPIVYVYVLEEYWPAHFNLPEDQYREVYGVEHPDRRYWRWLDGDNVDPATGGLVRGGDSSAEPESTSRLPGGTWSAESRRPPAIGRIVARGHVPLERANERRRTGLSSGGKMNYLWGGWGRSAGGGRPRSSTRIGRSPPVDGER
ncbi:MAG: hypothetical protein WD066_16820, partial [Planctomycetaceae bacterium]